MCIYHCQAGWLPLDRDEDHDEIAGEGELLMLFPTQLTPCPMCNELSFTNRDLSIDLGSITKEGAEHVIR